MKIVFLKKKKTDHDEISLVLILFFIISTLIISTIPFMVIPSNSSLYIENNEMDDHEFHDKTISNDLCESDNPGNFTLSIDRELVEEEESFSLIWTASDGAENYSVYESAKNITKIDGNSTLIAEGLTRLNYSKIAYGVGIKYYVIVARNSSGDTLSNCVSIIIEESEESEDDRDGDGGLLFALPPPQFLLIGIILFLSISGIMYYKIRKDKFREPHPGIPHTFERTGKKSFEKSMNGAFHVDKKVKPAKEIIKEVIKNETLLKLVEEGKSLKDNELSSISEDYLKKVDKIPWESEDEKIDFITEMLSLTPEERDDIIDYMLEKSKMD